MDLPNMALRPLNRQKRATSPMRRNSGERLELITRVKILEVLAMVMTMDRYHATISNVVFLGASSDSARDADSAFYYKVIPTLLDPWAREMRHRLYAAPWRVSVRRLPRSFALALGDGVQSNVATCRTMMQALRNITLVELFLVLATHGILFRVRTMGSVRTVGLLLVGRLSPFSSETYTVQKICSVPFEGISLPRRFLVTIRPLRGCYARSNAQPNLRGATCLRVRRPA